jgi:oleate hydratase
MTDSNWLMSVVLALQPHFSNQPQEVQVFWGYSLFPDKTGNFIKKKMSDCTGKEILQELFYHLKITDKMTPILEAGKINCLPCMMPFIDSLFMPRKSGDRPEVIPEGSVNFAFLGQFAEASKDCVFTVEYSVRCAQMAVFSFFKTNRKVLPVYPSRYKPGVLYRAIKALKR